MEKVGPNSNIITFNILPLTTGQFLSVMGTFPPGLEDTADLDPAECK